MPTNLLPPAASSHAGAIDAMLAHVHWVMLALFAGWSVYYVYLLVRYRASRQPQALREGTPGRAAIIVTAAVIVSEAVLLVGSALPLWFERTSGQTTPDALVIRVVGEQFMWNGHHPGADGRFGETVATLVSGTNPLGLDRSSPFGRDDLLLPGELHLPINRPVIIELSSKDVVHSFGVPAMRVRQDATPGTTSRVSFTPTMAGQFEVACSQLCGLGHHRMRAVIVVESDAAYQKYLASEAALQGVK